LYGRKPSTYRSLKNVQTITHHLVEFFIKKCESALRKTLKPSFVSDFSAALAAFQEFEDETEAFLQPFFAMLREEQLDGSSPFVTAAQVSFISQSLFFSMLREEQLDGSSPFVAAAQDSFFSQSPFFSKLREEQLDGSSPFVTAAQDSFFSQSPFFYMLREYQI
jgi:hypothetical protein